MSAAHVRQVVTFTVALALLIGLVPPAPAYAFGTDRGHTPGTGWAATAIASPNQCNSNTAGSPNRALDDDDATYATCPPRVSGTPGFSSFGVGWTSGVSPVDFDIESIVMKVGTCQSSHHGAYPGGACGTGTTITQITAYCTFGMDPYNQEADYTGYQVYDQGGLSITGVQTVEFDLTIPCHIGATPATGGTTSLKKDLITFFFTWATGAYSTVVYTVELYDGPPPPGEGDPLDYIYGLVCASTLFSKTCTWQWSQTYDGTWQVRRARVDPEDETVIKSGVDPVATDIGATCQQVDECERFFTDPCGITGCSGWVIEGYNADLDETWAYAIDDEADGVLIAEDPPIGIAGVSGCYNANYEQCGTGQLASTLRLTYSIRPDSQGDNVLVEIGPQYLYGPGFDGNPWYSDTVTGGVHTITMTSETPYPIAGQNLLIVATGPRNAVQVIYGIDWVDGGASAPIVIEDPDAPAGDQLEDCAFTDVGCFTRNLGDIFGNALASIFGGVEDLWTNALNGLVELAMSREPFASVIRASSAFTAQLADFNEETSATGDCPGLVLAIPLDAFPGMNYDGDNPEWTILDCALFEPLTSTTWYPTLRSAMDPLIYVFFAYGQLRRLQPKPSL